MRGSRLGAGLAGAIVLALLAGCAGQDSDLSIPGYYSIRPGEPGTLILTKQPPSNERVILELSAGGPAEVRWRLEFSEEYLPFEEGFYWGEGALHFQTIRRDPTAFLSLTGVLGDGREEPLEQEGDWSYAFKGTQFLFPPAVPAPEGSEGETSRGGWSVLTMKGRADSGASVALVLDHGTWVRMHGDSSGASFGLQAFVVLLLVALIVTFAFPGPRRFVRESIFGSKRDPGQSKKQPSTGPEPNRPFDPLGREKQKNN